MNVIFYLKGAVRIDWRVPVPDQFNFQLMIKVLRADGQFLADGVYIQASEIAAILLEKEDAALPVVHHKSKLERLVS